MAGAAQSGAGATVKRRAHKNGPDESGIRGIHCYRAGRRDSVSEVRPAERREKEENGATERWREGAGEGRGHPQVDWRKGEEMIGEEEKE